MDIENLRKKLLEQIEKLPDKQAKFLREQIERASPEQLEAFIKQKPSECFFCQIISGKIETIKVYEDDDILAILDIYPANPGHLIVIPKKHFQFINEISDSLLNKIFIFVKTIEPILLKVVKAQGASIYMAQGQTAGQNVPHFSVNVIPDVSLEWKKKKVEKKELEKIGKELREEAKKNVRENIEAERIKKEKEAKEKEESEAEEISKHFKPRIP